MCRCGGYDGQPEKIALRSWSALTYCAFCVLLPQCKAPPAETSQDVEMEKPPLAMKVKRGDIGF